MDEEKVLKLNRGATRECTNCHQIIPFEMVNFMLR